MVDFGSYKLDYHFTCLFLNITNLNTSQGCNFSYYAFFFAVLSFLLSASMNFMLLFFFYYRIVNLLSGCIGEISAV